MSPQAFIFMGRSGSGKGTQAALLIEAMKKIDPKRKAITVESGQELRNLAKGESFTSQLTKKTLADGGLLPEFMPIYLWGKLLAENYHGNEHMIFDGTPRKLMEAKVLDSVFPFYSMGKPWVIYLDVEHEESTKRLSLRGRGDDDAQTIQKRLSWFESEVKPSIDWYRANPNVTFLDIDGERSIEEIHADIVKRLGLE